MENVQQLTEWRVSGSMWFCLVKVFQTIGNTPATGILWMENGIITNLEILQ